MPRKLRVEVRPSDILSMFGYASFVHPGNYRFRKTIASARTDFLTASEDGRTDLVRLLLSQIKVESRFIAQNRDGTWRILTDPQAMLRIRRQFRRSDDDARYYSKKKDARQRKARQKYAGPTAHKLPPPFCPVPASANKLAQRPKRVISRFGAFLASFVWVTFGEEYKELETFAFNILRTLIFNEPHEPSKPGDGLVVTADRPYGKGPFVSSERKTYQRNTFADKVNIPTHDPDTHIVSAYATGTGRSTVGTPPSLICIREKTQQMKTFSDRVHRIVKQFTKPNKGIIMNMKFNVMLVHIMRPKQNTPFHSDCVFNPDGTFKEAANSQQKDSPVVIFVVGDTRVLIFKLMRVVTYADGKTDKVEVDSKYRIEVTLPHGSLFVLDPSDEKPARRFDLPFDTFWQHGGKGIPKSANIAFGLTLRTCSHTLEVYKDTGLMKLNKKHQSCFDGGKFKACHGKLESWCYGDEKGQKEADHEDLLRRFLLASDMYEQK